MIVELVRSELATLKTSPSDQSVIPVSLDPPSRSAHNVFSVNSSERGTHWMTSSPAYREQFLRAGQVAFVNAEHGTPDPEVILPNILDTDEESSGDEYSLMFVTLVDEENPTFRLEGWLGGFNPVPEALDPAEIGSFFLAGTSQMADVGIIEGDYEIDRDSPEAKCCRPR